MGQKLWTSWRAKIPYRRLDLSTPVSLYIAPRPKRKRRNWAVFRAETKAIEKANRLRLLHEQWARVQLHRWDLE